jgi:Domain of unknown function (DUF4111)
MNANTTGGATIGAVAVPSAEAGYLRAVVGRLAAVLGDGLVGVYPTGSVALSAYTPGRSDLDIMAVVAQPPPAPLLREVARRLSHDVLPCPATGLEFVLYPRDVVATASGQAGYLLDLNTGRELKAKASTDPAGEPRFWYVIDRAITAQSGLSLAGTPVPDLFTAPAFETLRAVVVESMRTHAAQLGEHGDNAVLNACRALRFGAQRRWYPKPVAALWAGAAVPQFSDLIESAMASYAAGRAARRQLPAGQVSAFLDYVLRQLTDR